MFLDHTVEESVRRALAREAEKTPYAKELRTYGEMLMEKYSMQHFLWNPTEGYLSIVTDKGILMLYPTGSCTYLETFQL